MTSVHGCILGFVFTRHCYVLLLYSDANGVSNAVSSSVSQSRLNRRFTGSQYSNVIRDGISSTEGLDSVVRLAVENFTSLQPTVWMGSDSGWSVRFSLQSFISTLAILSPCRRILWFGHRGYLISIFTQGINPHFISFLHFDLRLIFS